MSKDCTLLHNKASPLDIGVYRVGIICILFEFNNGQWRQKQLFGSCVCGCASKQIKEVFSFGPKTEIHLFAENRLRLQKPEDSSLQCNEIYKQLMHIAIYSMLISMVSSVSTVTVFFMLTVSTPLSTLQSKKLSFAIRSIF